MDEKEEGEISLEDVSSGDEANHNNWLKKEKKVTMDRKYDKRVEVDILPQDAVYGKENRQFSNELFATEAKLKTTTLEDAKDGLLPISSDEDVEIVGIPGSSNRMLINAGPKRRKKKKKKKKSGPRMLTIDDLESSIEVQGPPGRITSDTVMPVRDHYHETINKSTHNKYSPTSGRLYKSPTKHFKSSSHHARSPSPHRRSPRRLSPSKKPPISISDRHLHKSYISRYDDTHASSLLKKVRRLDSLGMSSSKNNKHREISLKDKLFTKSQNYNVDINNYKNDNGDVLLKWQKKEPDEEEDLDHLRQLALKTKVHKNEKCKESESAEEAKAESEDNLSGINYNPDDQDEEDLELRMIALRSAVMKKHHDRVQRGVVKKTKNMDHQIKSPFSDSFFEDIINDTYDKINVITPGASNAVLENVHVSDMEIDSDVEREKENQPYSPTDDLSDDGYEEAELSSELMAKVLYDQHTASVSPEIVNALLPTSNRNNHPPSNHVMTMEAPYSPSDPTQTPRVDRFLRLDQFNYNSTYMKSAMGSIPTFNSRAETPYSPTDNLVFDPELPVCPTELSFANNSINSSVVLHPNSSFLSTQTQRQVPPSNLVSSPIEADNRSMPAHFLRDPRRASAIIRESNADQSQQIHRAVSLRQSSVHLSTSEPRPMDLKGNQLNHAPHKAQGDERFDEIIKSLEEFTGEPPYLKGVPQVTNDANKIPTLVNRTLVPVTLLKTNEQLQQQKVVPNKIDTLVEKSFKHAEMQPIDVNNQSKTNSLSFKPIKIQPNVRKIQLIPIPTKGFAVNAIDDSSTDCDKTSDNLNSINSGNKETLQKDNDPKKRGRGRPKTPTKKASVKKILIDVTSGSGKSKTSSRGRGRPRLQSSERSKKIADESVITDDDDNTSQWLLTRRRSRSARRSEKKNDESPRDDSELSSNGFEKLKKETSRSVKGKSSKALESSAKDNDKSKTADDKKRRYSVDEDEEALRASLLASMTKKIKQNDDSVGKQKIDNVKNVISNDNSSVSSLKNNLQLQSGLNNAIVNSNTILSNNTHDQISKTSSNNTVYSLLAGRKKAGAFDVHGPMERIVKNSTTKNVDNVFNVVFPKIANQDLASPSSPKMSSSKNVQRMVINLGEDSDSDSEYSDSSPPSSLNRYSGSSALEAKKMLPAQDFSRKLDEFLRSQREQTESASKIATSTPVVNKKISSLAMSGASALNSTPQAVRHLPASKQEEYRRLKQKLHEKEQQKLIKVSEKDSTKNAKTKSASLQNSVKKTTRSTHSSDVSIPTTSSVSSVDSNKQTVPSRIDKNQAKSTDNAQEVHPNIPSLSTEKSLSNNASEIISATCATAKANDVDHQESTPIDFSIKSDPLAIVNDTIADPTLIDSISQEYFDDINSNVPFVSLGMRENLIIKIPNIRDDNITNYREISVSNNTKVGDKPSFSVPAAPVLSILTADQLNMKFENIELPGNHEKNEEKPYCNENDQIIPHVSTTDSTHFDNNVTSNTTIEENKVQPIFHLSDQSATNGQTLAEALSNTLRPKSELDDDATNKLESTFIITEDEPVNEHTEKHQENTINNGKETESTESPAPAIKSEDEVGLENYQKLPVDKQKEALSKAEKDLVEKRHLVLTDLAEMANNLIEWEKLRTTQAKLTEEVNKLKLELEMAEKCLEDEKLKITAMGPKITKTHCAINSGRVECVQLANLCHGLGTSVFGDVYSVPVHGSHELMEKLKEVSVHTKQLNKKRVSRTDNIDRQYDNNVNNDPNENKPSLPLSSNSQTDNSSGQQSTPLDLSVQITSEDDQNTAIKTESSAPIDPNLPGNSTTAQSTASEISSEQVRNDDLITQIKWEPIEVDSNNANATDLSSSVLQNQDVENQCTPEVMQTQVKTERMDVDENDEDVRVPNDDSVVVFNKIAIEISNTIKTEGQENESNVANVNAKDMSSVENAGNTTVKGESITKENNENAKVNSALDGINFDQTENSVNIECAAVNDEINDLDMSVVIISTVGFDKQLSENVLLDTEKTDEAPVINSEDTSRINNTSVQLISNNQCTDNSTDKVTADPPLVNTTQAQPTSTIRVASWSKLFDKPPIVSHAQDSPYITEDATRSYESVLSAFNNTNRFSGLK